MRSISDDTDVTQDAVMVYNSNRPKENIPDIFGKKLYHDSSQNSVSLTSQIVKKRLNETGKLSQLQKLFPSQNSDFGQPTFYDGDNLTNNAAISNNNRQ